MIRFRQLALLATILVAAPVSAAPPREELLHLAPPDAALLILVQNARDHAQAIRQSPFAEWFPQSAIGKQLFATFNLKQAQATAGPIFAALGIKPEEALADVFGDAVAFAYSPASTKQSKKEQAVILVRPRKPETLARLVARLNEIQKASGEVKAVATRSHNGEEYFERQKSDGGAEYYRFSGNVFAFSSNEDDIRAVIDREKADKKSPLPARLDRLEVREAAFIALVNPRRFDEELGAKLAKAHGPEKVLLGRFQEFWQSLDSAGLYLTVGTGIELGISLQFQPGKRPTGIQSWFTGRRTEASIWQAIPANALFAVAARLKPADLIAAAGPSAQGANPLHLAVEQILGPVVGKEKLPHVVAALGPESAIWVVPPMGGGFLPTVVGAVQIDRSGPKGKEAAREIARAVAFAFNTLRIAYNASHTDQIEVVETESGEAIITSMANAKGFPAGFQPSYAFKGGFLLVATSPGAIERFQAPKPGASAKPEARLSTFSATAIRGYLLQHRGRLAKYLASTGRGAEKDLLKQFDQSISTLDLLERIEVYARGNATGIRVALKIAFAKPLKK